jgi:mRNA interferase MazF
MRLMIVCNRGDVVLINFVLADESGVKRRPAVVISSVKYQQGRQEAIIAVVTSQTARIMVGDYRVSGWQKAGLLYPSVVTGIIRTIKQEMISSRLGTLAEVDMQGIDNQLRFALSLD